MTDSTTATTDDGCTPGTEGCSCVDGACLGGELECIDGVCSMPDCTPNPDFDTDPNNCGQCGIECIEGRLIEATCEAGSCIPQLGPCHTEPIACTAACAEIGETCVPDGCRSDDFGSYHTAYGFIDEPACESPNGGVPVESFDGSCDQEVYTLGGATRCCCTDTPG